MKQRRFENENETFYISRRKMRNYHEPHMHDYFEILYLFAGERWFFINDRTFKMKEGGLILIHPSVLHKAASNETPDCEGILLYFHELFLAPNHPLRHVLKQLFEFETASVNLNVDERATIEDLFLKLLREDLTKNTGYQLAVQGLLLQLLVFLNRIIRENRDASYEYPSPIHEKVSEIACYINKNYREDLSLNALARLFYISPNYLSKVFKDATNFTYVEYLNNVRVKEAKRLLMESDKKVADVSGEVGFGSITHFGRIFKKITGHTPMYYRKIGKP